MTAPILDTYPFSPSEYGNGFDGDQNDLMRLFTGQLWERVAEGTAR